VSHRVPGRAACPRRLYYTRYYMGAAIRMSQPPTDGRGGGRMRDAVIGSTAQIPIGKAYRGALSDISGPSSPRTPSPPPSAGQGSQARRSTTSPWAAPCRKARPALRGLAGRAPRRTVRRRAGRDRRPAVRLRADGDRDRRQADHRRRHDRHRRRRRRIDLAGAERARTLTARRTCGWPTMGDRSTS
jgi:hypothetical protein